MAMVDGKSAGARCSPPVEQKASACQSLRVITSPIRVLHPTGATGMAAGTNRTAFRLSPAAFLLVMAGVAVDLRKPWRARTAPLVAPICSN